MLYGTVCCLGDSLLAGARSDVGGPAELLGPLLTARAADGVEWAGLDRSECGDTTLNVLRRAPAVCREVAAMPGAKWLVLLCGTNDAKRAVERGPSGLDLWGDLYRQLLHWPRRYGLPIAVCTLPPMDPDRMPCYPDRPQTERWRLGVNARVRGYASDLDGRPVTVRLVELEDLDPALLCDGVHLRLEGYGEVARRIADALIPPRLAPARAELASSPEAR